jgi:hypothetical protein
MAAAGAWRRDQAPAAATLPYNSCDLLDWLSAGAVVARQRCYPDAFELEDSSREVSSYMRHLLPQLQQRSCPVCIVWYCAA